MPDSQQRSKNTAPFLRRIVSACALLISSGCSVFGVESVEEAAYQLVQKDEQFEVRDYESVVVVETRVNASFRKAGNQSFRRLFRYITGANAGSQKIAMTAPVIADTSGEADAEVEGDNIAMTAPVVSQKDGEQWSYRFVLPKTFTIDTAPKPTNPDVYLVEVPQKRVATLRYSGRATAKKQAAQALLLQEWVNEQGFKTQSEPRWAGYNSPWAIPWFRRNEVLIDLSE